MKNQEHAEQAALIAWRDLHLRQYPDLEWLIAIPNGGLRHKSTAARLKAEGAKAGVWDLFLPVPRLIYHGCWLEMKIKPNKLTQAQIRWGEAMLYYNYYCLVCYSWLEAAAALQNYLALT